MNQALSHGFPEFRYFCDSNADCDTDTICLESLYTNESMEGQLMNGRGCYEWEVERCDNDEIFAAGDDSEYEQYRCYRPDLN